MLTLLILLSIQDGPSLNAVLDEAGRNGFHGNVLVTQRGEVLAHRGSGLANRDAGTPFTVQQLMDHRWCWRRPPTAKRFR